MSGRAAGIKPPRLARTTRPSVPATVSPEPARNHPPVDLVHQGSFIEDSIHSVSVREDLGRRALPRHLSMRQQVVERDPIHRGELARLMSRKDPFLHEEDGKLTPELLARSGGRKAEARHDVLGDFQCDGRHDAQ
jgi:hypothetical protein